MPPPSFPPSQFTGRTAELRRWSEGIHQAVEAKEGVEVKPISQNVAQITYQSLFRLYGKAGGMTGTAKTEVRCGHPRTGGMSALKRISC